LLLGLTRLLVHHLLLRLHLLLLARLHHHHLRLAGLLHLLLLVDLALEVLLHLRLHHAHRLLLLHHGLSLHLRLHLHLLHLPLEVLLHLRLHHHLGLLLHHGLLHRLLHLLVIAHRSDWLLHSHGEHLSHLLGVREPCSLLNWSGGHLLRMSSLLGCCTRLSCGGPLTSKMDLASSLTLISNREPLIQASGNADRGQLHLAGTNSVVGSNIFIEDFDGHVVSDVLDIDFEHLVPLRGLACVLLHLGLVALLSVLNDTEGVHLAEELSVASEFGFHYGKLKFA